MRTTVRILAILAAAAAALSGAMPPRSRAFAIEDAKQWSGNGHWYKYYPRPNSSVLLAEDAIAAAKALGGYLVTLTSAEEDAWYRENVFLPAMGSQTQFNSYMGGRQYSAGTWTWMSGEPWAFTGWQAGQPTNASYETYLVYRQAGGMGWDDVDGGYQGVNTAIVGYTVEWDSDPNSYPPPEPPAPPSDLTASVSPGTPIRLTWTDNSTNETKFEIQSRTEAGTFALSGYSLANNCRFEDYFASPSVTYSYRVRAVNSGGASEWSNEASATASSMAPGPRAPSDLAVLAAAPDSFDLGWIDNSEDEIGFEVHRRRPGGEYSLVASLPPGSWGFTDTGLPPDADYEYGVRSLNAFRASGFCEVAAATLPTLAVTPLRADLKDSPKFGKDSMKVQAVFEFLPESPDALWDAISEGITLRVGPVDRPVVMSLPKNLDTWLVKGTKATWKSAKGATPKYSIQVDMETRTVKATAAGLELPEPPSNPMRVSIAVGDDAGTAKGDWEAKKTGVFQLR